MPPKKRVREPDSPETKRLKNEKSRQKRLDKGGMSKGDVKVKNPAIFYALHVKGNKSASFAAAAANKHPHLEKKELAAYIKEKAHQTEDHARLVASRKAKKKK